MSHSKNTDGAQKQLMLVDAHSDFLCDVLYRRRLGETKVLERLYLPMYRQCGLKLVVAAIYLESMFVPHMALEIALEMIACLKKEIDESPGLFQLCLTGSDIDGAMACGKVAILLSLEGAEPIGNNLSLLRVFFELGIRFMGLTWARRNAAADGTSAAVAGVYGKAGLTSFGRELVAEACSLGITIDVSHLNDAGFDDLAVITKRPIFASHSNARALAPKERNISDEIIKYIAVWGGVVAVNTVNTLVAQDDSEATAERVIDHIEHIAVIAGLDKVGFGFDFCENLPGYEPSAPLKQGERKIRDIIPGYGSVGKLIEGLHNRGLAQSDVEGIAGENLLRFYKSVLPADNRVANAPFRILA